MGAHQRLKILPKDAKIRIETHYDPPTATGTIAEGYVVAFGETWRYREVDWPEDMQNAAMLAANRSAGSWDDEMAGEVVRELDAAGWSGEDLGFEETQWSNWGAPVHQGEPEEEKEKAATIVECPKCQHQFSVIEKKR